MQFLAGKSSGMSMSGVSSSSLNILEEGRALLARYPVRHSVQEHQVFPNSTLFFFTLSPVDSEHMPTFIFGDFDNVSCLIVHPYNSLQACSTV